MKSNLRNEIKSYIVRSGYTMQELSLIHIFQARNNSQEHFRFPFNDAFMDVVIGRMAQNQQFCERVLDDAKFGDTVRDLLVGVVYERLRSTTGSGIHP